MHNSEQAAAIRTPVLLLLFNRPKESRVLLEAIRKVRPATLYVAADGPRENRPDDYAKCTEVRSLIESIDWPCRIERLFRSSNLGCKHAVADALDWFFSNEECGIILEDDVIPVPAFFSFCESLLIRYADSPRVAMIGGFNPWVRRCGGEVYPYSFSSYALIWGWATWRRAWRNYDVNLVGYQRSRNLEFLSQVPTMSPRGKWMWRSIFDAVVDGKIDTWDYQWFYSMMHSGALAVLPRANLVSNIGYGPDATHAVGNAPDWAAAEAQNYDGNWDPPPERINVDVTLESAIARKVFLLTPWNEFKFWVRSRVRGWLAEVSAIRS